MASKRTALLLATLVVLVSCSQVLVDRVARTQSLPVEPPALAEQVRSLLRLGPAGEAQLRLEEAAADLEPLPWSLRAAAALDAGSLPPEGSEPASPTLDRRIQQAAERVDAGAALHLFDRLGRPIGFVDEDGTPQWSEGLESLDLSGSELTAPERARGLRLSIDAELTRRLGRKLQGVQASVVVLDARDGTVLFAGSDRRSRRRRPGATLYEQLEPASIAKMITTTAGLRAGLDVDSDLHSYRCRGSTMLGGSPLYCTAIKGRLGGLARALATSCNSAFADLGSQLGREAVIAEYELYGFGRRPSESPAAYGWARPLVTARELGDLSIGLNQTEMTPLHGAVIARSWIDGLLLPPTLHLAADSPLGNAPRRDVLTDPVREGSPESRRVIDEEWLPLLHRSLLEVTSRRGTASLVAPPDFPAAMKTGTGQTEGHGFHTNYLGFAPEAEPLFAFAIRVRRGPTSRSTRRATKALTRQVLRALRDYSDDYVTDSVLLRHARSSSAAPGPAPDVKRSDTP